MRSLNRVDLIGNLGEDPESREFPDGTLTCTFSIATSEEWKDKKTGEKKERKEWHRCVTWRNVASIAAQYLHKGKKVWVSGRLQTREYQHEGTTKYSTEVVVNDLILLEGRAASQEQRPPVAAPPSSDADDLPF